MTSVSQLCVLLIAVGTLVCSGLSLEADEVSFRNDVMAVMSKAGCNLGTCHGNARGKGGFQISLRGQDPRNDFLILTRDWSGRRVNVSAPDQSLMLLKPTQQIAHEGGRRFDVDSPEYRILREWIAKGMPDDVDRAPRLVRLDVQPQTVFLKQTNDEASWRQQITVSAVFADQKKRDVRSLAVYEVSHPIANVSHDGLVTGQSAGETTVLVRYLDLQAAVRLAFVPQRADFRAANRRSANPVDVAVDGKLVALRMNPSPPCDDATFVRRVHLDLIGSIPTAQEAREFVKNRDPHKRAALVDSLLNRPEYADWWALKWADLLRIEEKTLDRKGVENFHGWLRDAFATNKPLDRMIREIISGRGSTYEVPPANFYRALRTPFERSEAVAQLFLGVRLQCAKCHNHPFDRWTQDDYYSWGSVFGAIDYKILENKRRDNNDKHEFDGEQIVFLTDDPQIISKAKDPRNDEVRSARFLGANDARRAAASQKAPLSKERGGVSTTSPDVLDDLGFWLTEPDNERFIQMLANRIWQQVQGRGVVDPVDDFRATNPPSNPELLKVLASELKASRFDLRHMLRLIVTSQTYQASSEPNETNRDDESNFSRALVHRLSAEQLLDATSQVCGVPVSFTGYPSGPRAIQIPGVFGKRPREEAPSDADRFLKIFGKPQRLQSCDCERSEETTLGQTFQLVSGSLINQMLATQNNRLEGFSAASTSVANVVDELYWTTLSRAPTPDELAASSAFLTKSSHRRAALEDLTWSLLNSNEFLLRR